MSCGVKFSFIIASYNEGNRIVKALDSIKKQCYSSFEAIVVDDGSDDKSIKVLRNYSISNAWVKVIYNSHEGVSKARNDGIDASKGEYLIFLDADDYLCEGILEKYAEIIAENPSVDIIFPNYVVRKEKENEEIEVAFFSSDLIIDAKNEKFIQKLFKKGIYPGAKGCFLRELVKDHSLYMRSDLVVCEDIDWFLKVLLLSKKVAVVAYNAYVYVLFDKHSIPTYERYRSQVEASKYWIERIDNLSFSSALKRKMKTFFCRTFVLFSMDICKMEDLDKKKSLKLCYEKLGIARSSFDIKSNVFFYFAKVFGVARAGLIMKLLTKRCLSD